MKGNLWEWSWVEDYADVTPCIELSAIFDDNLKKKEAFTNYAVLVAQRIIGDAANVTYGKWGARLETGENKGLSREELERLARMIVAHPSWHGLRLSTIMGSIRGKRVTPRQLKTEGKP